MSIREIGRDAPHLATPSRPAGDRDLGALNPVGLHRCRID
jgi:hypothetical protein